VNFWLIWPVTGASLSVKIWLYSCQAVSVSKTFEGNEKKAGALCYILEEEMKTMQ